VRWRIQRIVTKCHSSASQWWITMSEHGLPTLFVQCQCLPRYQEFEMFTTLEINDVMDDIFKCIACLSGNYQYLASLNVTRVKTHSYFSFNVTQPICNLAISVQALYGDPDLYVSMQIPNPNEKTCAKKSLASCWSSTKVWIIFSPFFVVVVQIQLQHKASDIYLFGCFLFSNSLVPTS
jgi:hypothetical protein